MNRPKFLLGSTSLLAVAALASDASLAAADMSQSEADRVEALKQSFLQIGRDLIAKETQPLKDWANRTMSQDAHIALQAIDRVGTGLLSHIMNALHPYGMENAVEAAAAAAAAEADALAQANAVHGDTPAQDALAVAGAAVEAAVPGAAPVVAAVEAAVDPLLASAGSGSTGSAVPGSGSAASASTSSASPVTESAPPPVAPTSPPSAETPTSNSSSGEPEQPDLPLDPQPAAVEPSTGSADQSQG